MSMLNVSPTPMHPDSGRRLSACILSPRLWRLPTRSRVLQWMSTTIDVYCKGLEVLMKPAATLFGFKDTRSHAVPGEYPLDLESNEQQVKSSSANSEHPKIKEVQSEDKGSRSEGGLKARNQDPKKLAHDHPIKLLTINSSLGLNSPYSPASRVTAKLLEEDSANRNKYLSVVNQGTSPKHALHAISTSTTINVAESGPSEKPEHSISSIIDRFPMPVQTERTRKYAGMRTLRLPGKQQQSFKPPTETQLALRQIDEELAVAASELDEYCARELAGKGISLRLPEAAKSQPGGMLYTRTARRIWRETSVGPVNPAWNRRHSRDVPIIHISKPEGVETLKVIDGRMAVQNSPASGVAAVKRGSSRSNAVYIPLRDRTTLSVPPTFPHFDSPSKPASEFSDPKTRAEAAKRLNKRTSMSDWLEAISAGNNSLVDDDVAAKAAPLLCASLILSSTPTPPLSPAGSASSSDSSVPSTPIDDLFLPLPLVEETKAADGLGDRRRRARCSYLGDYHDIVVAPTIPEELLTEEIGVAC